MGILKRAYLQKAGGFKRSFYRFQGTGDVPKVPTFDDSPVIHVNDDHDRRIEHLA